MPHSQLEQQAMELKQDLELELEREQEQEHEEQLEPSFMDGKVEGAIAAWDSETRGWEERLETVQDRLAIERHAWASRKRSEMEQGTGRGSRESEITDLPLECIALILSHTTPADAMRFASTSSMFAFASTSDLVWSGILPSDIDSVCDSVWPSKIECALKKDRFLQLRKERFVDSGCQTYALDARRGGGLCRKLSFQRMNISWGKDERFWRVEESRCSSFGKVAHLLAVCWLEINGVWSCSLIPGAYSVKWRIKVRNPLGGRMNYLTWKNPVLFVLQTNDGQTIRNQLDMAEAPFIGFEQWAEFEVGTIQVSGWRRNVKDMQLSYSIREVDCEFWKGGLFIDCLVVESCRS